MRLSKTVLSVLLAGLLAILAAATTPLTAHASPSSFDSVGSVPRATSIVSPAPNEVWVSGTDDNNQLVLSHFVNGTWTQSTIPGLSDGSLEGSASDDVWLRSASSLHHFDGATWSQVAVPAIPGATGTWPRAMADVPGPDFYAGFSYFQDGSTKLSYARYDGSAWTVLGAPIESTLYLETPNQLEFVDGALVSIAWNHNYVTQYSFSYADGQWSEPLKVGQMSPFGPRNQWVEDWVVNSPTDIWLYGAFSDEGIPTRSWCGHFNGTALDSAPCVAGGGVGVTAAAELPDGRHMVGAHASEAGSRFDLLDQPAQQTPIEGVGVTQIYDLAAEPGTGVVWALAIQPDVPGVSIMRYGVADDTRTYALTASGPSVVQQGDVATFTGTVDPVSSVAAERRLVLQVKTGTTWTRVTTKRAAADGTYSFNARLPRAGTFTYRVKKAASGDIAAGFSNTVDVTVLEPFNLTIKAPTQVAVGDKLVIKGKVTPVLTDAGERGIELQAKSGATWKTVTTDQTAADGSYRFAIATSKVGRTKYRVLKPAAGIRDAAASRKVTVTVS